jgi:hypothetical protein
VNLVRFTINARKHNFGHVSSEHKVRTIVNGEDTEIGLLADTGKN